MDAKTYLALSRPQRQQIKDTFIDFSNLDLSGENFYNCELSECNFKDCNLEDAAFDGAKLVGSDFRRAKIKNTSFYCSDLEGATFSDATILSSDFSLSNVTSTNFSRTGFFCILLNHYNVYGMEDIIRIGCQEYTLEEWKDFTDEQIDEMDDDASIWWNHHKTAIISLAEYYKEKP